jgi:hypothetical protein
LPAWAAVDGIVYPPHLNMEQCSSEQTARYKAQLVNRKWSNSKWSNSKLSNGQMYVDLTGGLGVDFYWMSQGFQQRCYVEQNADLCAIAEHNFRLLNLPCSVVCSSAADMLSRLDHATVIYLDPARRNEHGGRAYGIEDCTPNILELLPQLLDKSDSVVLKLSPMLDWRKAVSDLGCVSEVHIVSVDNECKELLLVLEKESSEALHVHCVNNDSTFSFIPTEGTTYSHGGNNLFPRRELPFSPPLDQHPLFLYEPNASIMKAGCFAEVGQQFPVQQLAANSHLFVSSSEIDDFPGRRFQITAVLSMNKHDLKRALADVGQANITVRNFPMTADQLRKKLKLKDGGSVFLFATTLHDGQHRLLVCRKIG